jgi:hypothetical protein
MKAHINQMSDEVIVLVVTLLTAVVMIAVMQLIGGFVMEAAKSVQVATATLEYSRVPSIAFWTVAVSGWAYLAYRVFRALSNDVDYTEL